jgi:hypothetical protein
MIKLYSRLSCKAHWDDTNAENLYGAIEEIQRNLLAAPIWLEIDGIVCKPEELPLASRFNRADCDKWLVDLKVKGAPIITGPVFGL